VFKCPAPSVGALKGLGFNPKPLNLLLVPFHAVQSVVATIKCLSRSLSATVPHEGNIAVSCEDII
jgi:hypothetical protein